MFKNNSEEIVIARRSRSNLYLHLQMLIKILQITIIFITIFAINSVLASIKADIYKKEGKESLKKNFPYLAVSKFSKALNLDSSDGEARGYLGIAYTSLAEKTNKGELLKKAIYEMKDARKTYEDSSINYHLAKTYKLSGDIDTAIQEAIKSYNQIPSGQTKDKLIALYKTKGDTLLLQNKKDEAIKFYIKVVELKQLNVTNEDIADYELLRGLMPDNFFIRYNLARLYTGQSLWDKTIIELEHIREIGIFNDDIMGRLIYSYYLLGHKYYNEKKLKDGERYLNYIVDADPINKFGYSIPAINTLSSIYEQTGNIDKTVETLLKLEEIDTQKGQGYYKIGHLFNRRANFKEAIKYFEKYMPFRPVSDTGIFTTLGSSYEQVGDIDKAVETLLKLEEIDTQKGQGYYQIGQLYNKRSNIQKTIEYYEKYLPYRHISNVSVFIYLGELYEQVGDIDRAIKSFRKLEYVNSHKGQGHYYIGLLYKKKERWTDALKEFEKVFKIKPGDSNILLEIGELYEKIGNTRKALDIYKQAIDIDPILESVVNPSIAKLYQNLGEKEKAMFLFKKSKIL